MNRLNSGRACQVHVIIVPVTTVVPKRDELVTVGEQQRPSARKLQPREFITLRAQQEQVASKGRWPPFPGVADGGQAGPGRLVLHEVRRQHF